MIDFRYFCYTECARRAIGCSRNRKTVWGVFFSDDPQGGRCYYLIWGSPKKPIIRSFWPAFRGESVFDRIREKKKSQRHIKVELIQIPNMFPELVSEIEQYIVVQRLRNG